MRYKMNRSKNISGQKQLIKEYWSENVPGLDDGKIKGAKPGDKEFYIEAENRRYFLEPYIPPLIRSIAEKNKLMLEVGCGSGADLRKFARHGMNVIGLDLSTSNANLTKQGLNVFNLKGEVINSDAENLPFKPGCLDIVYSFGVLHHTPNTKKAIDEIHRILKDDGKSLIMLYHKGAAYYWIITIHSLFGLKWIFKSKEKVISEKYDHTPLSKMYNRKEIKDLFMNFKNIEIDIITFGGVQANKKLKWIYTLLNKYPSLMRLFGSFIIIKAQK